MQHRFAFESSATHILLFITFNSVIKSFIRESVKGANEEIANILKAKEEEKQRRAEAKKLAKKQAQEENK